RPQARLTAQRHTGRARALPRGSGRAGGAVGGRPAIGRGGARRGSLRGPPLRARGPRPRPRATRARARAGGAVALPPLRRGLGRGRLRAEPPGVEDRSLRTNGVLLDRLAGPLVEAGLRRLNVSLDSLSHVRFSEITRRDALDRVLAGLEEAERHPELRPIKVN